MCIAQIVEVRRDTAFNRLRAAGRCVVIAHEKAEILAEVAIHTKAGSLLIGAE